MALITRFTRLFRADLHAVLDRVEEPDVLLKQAVREMEEDVAGDEQRAKLLHSELTRLNARQTDLKQSLQHLEGEIDICFESDKDDLARTVIKRKLEAQQLLKAQSRKHRSVADSLAAIEIRLEENRERLAAMQQKSELLTGEDATIPSDQACDYHTTTVRDEDVEVAFLRERQKRSLP